MENKCLVTKLQKSINDENLPILGKAKVKFNAGDIYSIIGAKKDNVDNCNLEIISGTGYFSDITGTENRGTKTSVTKIYGDYLQQFYVKAVTDVVVTVELYKLAGVTLSNKPGITTDYNNTKNLKYISSKYISLFRICEGYISDFENLDYDVLNLAYPYSGSTGNITGNIKSISHMTNLKEFNFSNTKVTGSIEEFVKGQVNAGRTECLSGVKSNLVLMYLTFGGVIRENSEGTRDYGLIVWKGADNIAVYTGGNTVDEATIVRIKGDASLFNTDGKTVVQIDA